MVDVQPGMKTVFIGKQYYGWMATVLPDLSKGVSKKGAASKAGEVEEGCV